MDRTIQEKERAWRATGSRDDAVAYVMAMRRAYGDRMPSSLKNRHPNIVIIDNFVCRASSRNAANRVYRKSNVKIAENFAFFDALEFDSRVSRDYYNSPCAIARSIVDGDSYAVSPLYIYRLLPMFVKGIIVGKFTFSNAGGVQSLVLEK